MALDWGTVPAQVATATAVVGTFFALRQFRISGEALRISAQSQGNQVDIARANLLLAIDREFESAELTKSRKALRMLRNRIEREVLNHPDGDKSPELQKSNIAREFSRHLDKLWGEVWISEATAVDDANDSSVGRNIHKYYELMALPNWIETVGMLCTRNLLPKEDVFSLYASVIYVTMFNFQDHIDTRKSDKPHPNRRFMENAHQLYLEAIDYRKRRDEPLPARPEKSRLPWR